MTIKLRFTPRFSAYALALGAALAATVAATPASADFYMDVEHARANARAGGPVSEHDAELLERYGTTSGTPEWRHRVRDRFVFSDGNYDERPRRHRGRRHHRH